VTDFHLPIRNPYHRNKKLPVALLHFTAGFLLLNGWYEARIGHYPPWLGILFLLMAIFEIAYTFFAAKVQYKYPGLGGVIRLVTVVAFAVYAWILFGDGQNLFGVFMILVTVAFVLIYFIEKRWNRPFVVRVNEEGIWFPRIFRSQLFPWNRFNHVILRNNLLTLDFTSNRVVQLDLDKTFEVSQAINFNVFCTRQLDGTENAEHPQQTP
jgi:hypothetical protein